MTDAISAGPASPDDVAPGTVDAGAAPPADRGPHRRARAVLRSAPGWLAVVAVLVGAAGALIPIDNRGVQDCGTPAAFLINGRVDSRPDEAGRLQRSDGRVVKLSDSELERAYNHRCSERVADRMVPVGVAISAGFVLGLLVLIISLIRWWRTAPVRRSATHIDDSTTAADERAVGTVR